MPTVFRWNGYRFYFFSNEGFEPPHVSCRQGRMFDQGLADARMRKMDAERDGLLEAWNGYFGRQDR